MDSTVLAAVVAGGVSLIVAGVSSLVTLRMANARAGVDERLLRLNNEFSMKLKEQEEKHEREMAVLKAQLEKPADFGAAMVAKGLLLKFDSRIRTFDRIKQSLPGYSDDKIREILIGLPAEPVRVISGRESWKLKAELGSEDPE